MIVEQSVMEALISFGLQEVKNNCQYQTIKNYNGLTLDVEAMFFILFLVLQD